MKKLDVKYAARILMDCHTGDPENDHINADQILIDLLLELGYTQTVKEFKLVEKWYS